MTDTTLSRDALNPASPPQHKLSSLRLSRHLPHAPEKVFAALSSKAAMQVWACPAPGLQITVEPFDFRPGGLARTTMSFGEGDPYINEDHYQEIIPGQRIIQTNTLRCGDELHFAGVVVMLLTPEAGGTRLDLDEHGCFPDGRHQPEDNEAGWGQMLDRLAAFLEG